MTWPTEWGGGGRSALERFVVTEALIDAGAPIAASWFADRQMGPTLLAYGTDDQKRRFLPGILSGETGWCIGMSEPDAGSDLAGLGTRAVRDGEDLVIDGQKIWTSFGASADYCYLICRTSTDGPRHTGISELIVPMDSAGITVQPIEDMTTNRHFCEVWFDGVRGAGGQPGRRRGRVVPPDHAPARARAGRHRPAAVQPRPLPRGPGPGRHVRPARPARPSPGWRPATASAGCWCCGRSSARRPSSSRRPPRPSAPSTSRPWPTSWPPPTAPRPCCGAGWPRASATRPPYTIMGGTSTILRNILGERTLGLPREPRPTA